MNNQKGIVHIILLLLLLGGIVAGVYIVQKNQIFKSKASNPYIVFKNIYGQALSTNSSGIPQSNSSTVKVELISSLSSSMTGSAKSGRVDSFSYKIAENPLDLEKATFVSYSQTPTIITYTFKDPKPGQKFLWVDFQDVIATTQNGKVTKSIQKDRKSAKLDIISSGQPALSLIELEKKVAGIDANGKLITEKVEFLARIDPDGYQLLLKKGLIANPNEVDNILKQPSKTKPNLTSEKLTLQKDLTNLSIPSSINSCGEITSSGSYILTQDLTTQSNCFNTQVSHIDVI